MRSISLFTGAGGLDLGLDAAGFTNQLAVEMDPVAVRTLRANQHRWGLIIDRSVHEFIDEDAPLPHRADALLRRASLQAGEIDLLAGGPPCQPFSKSGYWAHGDSKRLDDPRAKTLDAYLDVLATAQPLAFLLENVPGLSYTRKNEGLTHLRSRVEAINRELNLDYSFQVAELNCAEYGVPQLRRRVFVIGHRAGRAFEFPSPTHSVPPPVDMSRGVPELAEWTVAPGLLAATTAWDAIGDCLVDELDPELQPRGKWAEVLATIPEGANYLWHTNRGGGLSALWGWRTRYWSMLLKLAKARPSWTLTAKPGPATGPFHWNSRRLATAELAALQTFPRDYAIIGNNREAHLQLGNAVPSGMAEILGRAMVRQFFNREPSEPLRLIPVSGSPPPPPRPPQPVSELPARITTLVREIPDHAGPGQGPARLQG